MFSIAGVSNAWLSGTNCILTAQIYNMKMYFKLRRQNAHPTDYVLSADVAPWAAGVPRVQHIIFNGCAGWIISSAQMKWTFYENTFVLVLHSIGPIA